MQNLTEENKQEYKPNTKIEKSVKLKKTVVCIQCMFRLSFK